MPINSDSPLASPMRMALTVLLDSVPDSRKVLRHLAAVEHDLGVKDADGKFLRKAPAERLGVVLRQLDSLLGESPPHGLVALRACLEDAIARAVNTVVISAPAASAGSPATVPAFAPSTANVGKPVPITPAATKPVLRADLLSPASTFLEEDDVEISEVRASQFDQLHAAWNPEAVAARQA